jgi:hypothetical protein
MGERLPYKQEVTGSIPVPPMALLASHSRVYPPSGGGLKIKRAPCGGYQAYVAGFSSKAQAFEFAQTARERTGLPVTIIKA